MTAERNETWKHNYADLGDVRLHYVEQGSGPLVILLHGFPEFWYSWRRQIPVLAEAGFRVVTPDMRGYNLSDKPRGVAKYRVELLARDVERLSRALGAERAAVVGHDWGAAVAWAFAMRYPERFERLAILNVPHPATFATGLFRPAQLLRSYYIFAFQIPALPEATIRAGNFRAIRRIFRDDPVNKSAFTDEDIQRYVEALAQPDALTSAINYYRALFRTNPLAARRDLAVIEKPVQVIWGRRDRALGVELSRPPQEWVPNLDYHLIPDASHWVQNDQPERVNELLLGFLRPVLGTSQGQSTATGGNDATAATAL